MFSSNITKGKDNFILLSIILLSCINVYVNSAPAACSAQITLNSTYPSHAFYLYYDIVVMNTGMCGIIKASVLITLPPDQSVFQYNNVSSESGELYGLPKPLISGSSEIGGTIVLNSMRVPEVVLNGVECDTLCNPDKPTTSPSSTILPSPSPLSPSSSIKVEMKPGSNSWWFAFAVASEGTETKRVHFRHSSSDSWVRMNTENWGPQATYTYSASTSAIALPISLQLASIDGETVTLENVITSFSNAIVDTNTTYGSVDVPASNNDNANGIQLAVHPDSNAQFIGLTPSNARVEIVSISVKAQNTDWFSLETLSSTPSSPSSSIFGLSTTFDMELPLSIQLTSSSNDMIVMNNIISSFTATTINTGLQF